MGVSTGVSSLFERDAQVDTPLGQPRASADCAGHATEGIARAKGARAGVHHGAEAARMVGKEDRGYKYEGVGRS